MEQLNMVDAVFLIALCHFLRAGGAGYQYVTGKFVDHASKFLMVAV